VTERTVGRPLLVDRPGPPYQSHEIHPAVFTPRQCDRIVTLGLELVAADGLLEGTDGAEVADEGIRRSTTAWLPPTDETWWIYEKLATVAARANRRYGFDLTGFGEDLQFTTYDEPGAFYSWHQDGLDGNVAGRKLSMVVQLTDPAEYRGAELQLFDVAEDFDDDELDAFTVASSAHGTVVVFPSFEYHRVLPLRSGVRHSLVAWISGPAFR
jgi:PKHD-type hydroxylase